MKPIVRIIGVPMDLGQSRRGVDMGPSALRYAGLQARLELLGYEVSDLGNVIVPNREEGLADTREKRLEAITTVCQTIYEQGRAAQTDDAITIFLGGDHSMSVGSVKSVMGEASIGVIWVDAHGDYNTPETSPSANIHGMPVAILMGEGPEPLVNVGGQDKSLHPEQMVQIGVRDLDAPERRRVLVSGIHVYTMRHIDEQGLAAIAYEALDILGNYKHIHVSLDLDALDPAEAPGVGTPVPGGLTYREAHLLMEILGDSGLVRSIDVVEVNPILDRANRTAELAVGLVASLLGKRIL
ncbi:MAG: arginase [Ardenticatenaceae bacterium]